MLPLSAIFYFSAQEIKGLTLESHEPLRFFPFILLLLLLLLLWLRPLSLLLLSMVMVTEVLWFVILLVVEHLSLGRTTNDTAVPYSSTTRSSGTVAPH